MSSLLPRQIDPHRLADKEGYLQGEIVAAELNRLGETAELLSARIPVSLEFKREAEGRLTISGQVSAEVELTCQRCMAPTPVKLKAEFSLVMVGSEQEATHLPDEFDPIICRSGERLNLNTIVEDELLLAMPIVVFHENEQDCGVNSDYLAAASNPLDEENRSSNPFEVLKKLKEDD